MRHAWKTAAIAGAVASALACGPAWGADKKRGEEHDNFYLLGEMNKASLVMTVEQGIVPKDLGKKIAVAVDQVIRDGETPGTDAYRRRPGDYLQLEPYIVRLAGPDATRMHSGRSRQDILATTRRLTEREHMLAFLDSLNLARGRVLALAEKNVGTIVPAYTNGVQAQPTTYAHYLLGFAAAFERDAERLKQAYARLNMSPLGGAALGTSSFPVNRKRLAELLGFDGVIENSYDAVQLATLDQGAELVGVCSAAALTVGVLIQDIHTQYHQTAPWIMIREGRLTGTSSIMPQKRNPNALNVLRLQASDIVGGAVTALIEGHNTTPGLPDYKREQVDRTLELSADAFAKLADLLDNLVVDKDRALAEVDADYSTTTELADILQRDSDLPFRVGHHFASDLVTFGRANKMKPADIPFDKVREIYAEAVKTFNFPKTEFPLSQAQYRKSLTAQNMLASSLGLGGPQESEVKRMLAQTQKNLEADHGWLAERRLRLARASAKLDEAFGQLMK